MPAARGDARSLATGVNGPRLRCSGAADCRRITPGTTPDIGPGFGPVPCVRAGVFVQVAVQLGQLLVLDPGPPLSQRDDIDTRAELTASCRSLSPLESWVDNARSPRCGSRAAERVAVATVWRGAANTVSRDARIARDHARRVPLCGTCKCVYPSSCIGQALKVMLGSRCFGGLGLRLGELSLGFVDELLSVGSGGVGRCRCGIGCWSGRSLSSGLIGGGRGGRPLVEGDGIGFGLGANGHGRL